MFEEAIVFIDSGVGGLPYLNMARNYLPWEKFVYVADNEYFPYGEKSSSELTEIIINLIKMIVEKIEVKLIVIACNTASVVTLSELRRQFGIPFVGVVPAIKPAGECYDTGKIGLLATRKTVTDPYTDGLIKQFASGCRVEKYAGIDLVDFVENSFFSSSEQDKMDIVLQSSKYFNKLEIDALVLGCTHFVYLKDYYKKSMSKSVDIIDSVEGVCQQILRILDKDSNADHSVIDRSSVDKFYITGIKYNLSKYLKFAKEFDLIWGGRL
jgi:glutamate racemase